MIRFLTFGYAAFFAAVVAIGYVPSFIEYVADERLLFGLFELSLIDDVTHAVTALGALIAALYSRDLSIKYLIVFGSYYALDATFFLIYGLMNDRPFMDDILLNLPHVIIAASMFFIAYPLAKRRG